MPTSQQLSQLVQNILSLGPRRISVLVAIGVAVMAAVGAAAYYLGRPAMQPIYTGLSAQDVSLITAALSEAGVPFDVNEQRSSVMVPFGQTTRARTLLAQKGLPASSRAGYELFDQLGSIGLTSFMQEITRVRALEGEIARTIQALDGVAAARVHIVLPDPGSFRRDRRDPSGSVLLRLNERWQAASAQAVRQIVAAAIPGMKIEQVSVTSTDGRVLASGGDERNMGNLKLAEMERAMASDLEQRAGRTLASAVGEGNFQVSVSVRLDVDREQVNETVYDPKSRIERSVKIIKQSGSTEDGGSKPTVGVEANLPTGDQNQSEGDKRRQREDRREELVNYELNTKTKQLVREGYRVEQLAIATVINRKQLVEQVGGNASKADVDARLEDLKRLIAASTGAKLDQKDRLEISAVDFPGDGKALAPVQGPGLMDYLMMNIGTGINALALLGVVFVVVWLGMRPAARILKEQPKALTAEAASSGSIASNAGLGLPAPEFGSMGANSGVGGDFKGFGFDGNGFDMPAPALSTRKAQSNAIRERLSSIVEENDESVTRVLKSWMQEAKEA